MSATSVRNALLSQLQADSVLGAEFGSTNVKKGIEANFDLDAATKGVRVGIQFSSQKMKEFVSKKVDAAYGFSLIAYFLETDFAKVDDRMILYDEFMREAVENIPDLGIDQLRLTIGTPQSRQHTKAQKLYF